jgi:type VI secretion system protein
VTVLVHFSGPSYGRTAVLEPGGAPIEAGRDPHADVHLPDQDRLISRRHVSLQWHPDGVQVTVLSKVNGIATPGGDFGLGESVVLAPGEVGRIGRFTFVAERPAAGQPATAAGRKPPEPIEQAGPASGFGASAFLPTQQAADDDLADPPVPVPPSAAAAAAAAETDPWAAFAKEWVPEAAASQPATPASGASLNRALDDAFSSSTAWRIEDMPVVDPLASASFQGEQALGVAFSVPGAAGAASPAAARPAQPLAPENPENPEAGMEAALPALCRGLGITGPPHLKERDWEQLGRSIRQIVQGLSEVMKVRTELRQEMRAVDRTMVAAAQDDNPLKGRMPLDELLHYLLFMAQGVAGYLPAQRAIEDTVDELRAHEFASMAAARALAEGALREFEPTKLRSTLLQGRRSLAGVLDNARLWDLYTANYAKKGEHMPEWLEQVFNRHFMPAYLRETDRVRREARAHAQRRSPEPPRS